MESNLQSSPQDNTDTKNAFRKPSSDAAHRNYRRRSPADGLPSSDGSPKRERSPSPKSSREDSVRVSDYYARKDDGRDRDNGKHHYGRNVESFRHSDRQNEDYIRHDKYADEDRYHERLSSRSGHGSRGDHMREGSDNRSKDYLRNADKYSRDKYDRSDYRSKEKDRETFSLEHHKYKGKDSSYDRSGSGRRHAPSDEVERERRTRDSDSRDESRDSHRSSKDYRSGKYRQKEAYESEQKELDGKKKSFEENKKYDSDTGRDKDRNTRKEAENISNEDKESLAKKPKLFVVEKEDNYADESQTSSSKHTRESNVESGLAKASGSEGITESDFNTAKVAAMKAAELVNKNLIGAGCLTTDQKKKLLWGNKKNTTVEESVHRWDTALFSDRERQEKFNKLMGVKGEPKAEQQSDDQLAEKQRELQLDLEKQYTAGLRRRDGRTVGLGL
ncbi:arginine/serine-rich coiled-coil protein 2 isoform X1 [Senna tora]|uniref:Arginine/serine-rich coiled-coil protein 2 isoform X1 n=1 Tax=Senna tora TaxID=362788 RepID=A0A834SNH4_9FABA|nr:arginine/serine-rich coiled-coil protein 2 isoform X1 [Senna tora]